MLFVSFISADINAMCVKCVWFAVFKLMVHVCVFVDDSVHSVCRVFVVILFMYLNTSVWLCALAPVVCSSCKEIASSHNRSIWEYF